MRQRASASPLFVRMYPQIRRDLARLGQLDHVHRRRIAAPPARPALQRGLELPERRVARPADRVERQACAGLAAVAFHFEPAEPAMEALRDRRRRLRRSIRIDQASASARSASRIACLARWRAPSARILAPAIRELKRTSRDLVLMIRHYSGPRATTQCH